MRAGRYAPRPPTRWGGSAPPPAIPALGQALSHEVSNLRKEAAAALGEIASPTALVFLEPAAGDPDPDVRKLVRWAIGRCQAAV